ncbi:MAG: 2OG-Fe(II) oxygenase [Parvularculaceae bacterium]
MLNLDAIRSAEAHEKPFRFLSATGALSAADAAAVRRDYPTIETAGFLPLSKLDARGAFAALIDDLQSDGLAATLGPKLGLDLAGKPRMITVRRLSKRGDGRIHNDSAAKICTMLIYLNETWDVAEGGAIRALNGPDDMDDYALEAPPTAGAVFAFARSETSWHGHPPFVGERYVIQTTFLTSQEELARKEQRGGLQTFLKRLNPFAASGGRRR